MGLLMMLMTIGGLIVAALMLAVAYLNESKWLLKFTLGGVAIWFAIYGISLVGVSLASKERILNVGEAKEFCGFYIDCHLHAAVTGIRTEKQLGDLTADGKFWIVKLKVFSDARNPSIAFRLLEPKARVLLPNGRYLLRDTAAERLLPTAGADLGADIKGSQTIEKEIVFDVAGSPDQLKLLVTEGYGVDKAIERVLIGDEDSLFHAQTFFKLQEQNPGRNAK